MTPSTAIITLTTPTGVILQVPDPLRPTMPRSMLRPILLGTRILVLRNHHLTPDLENLTISADAYSGFDQIRMSNGKGLQIEHIGSTRLSSPTASFLLKHVLHVPSTTKNLLSVHQFTLETNIYLEFHLWFFLVKEQG